jgi:hypothetical protein
MDTGPETWKWNHQIVVDLNDETLGNKITLTRQRPNEIMNVKQCMKGLQHMTVV